MNAAFSMPAESRELIRLVAAGQIADVRDLAGRMVASEAPKLETGTPGGFSLCGANDGLWGPLPPIAYQIDPVFPQGCIALISGYSSSKKSWLAAAAALSVSSGRPWLGRFATLKGSATILDKEAGIYEMRRRLHKLRLGIDEEIPDPDLDVCSFPAGGIFEPDFVKRLRDLASARAFLVLDTLAAFNQGVDENTAAMGEGILRVQEVAKDTNCTIALVAHEKKRGSDGANIDARERLRGSSSIFGAVDVVLSISLQKDGPLLVEQTKARGGKAVDPFEVAVEDTGDGGITIVAQDIAAEEPQTPRAKFAAVTESVLEAVRNEPRCGIRYIRSIVGGRASSVDEAVERLVDAGRLRNVGSKTKGAFVVAQEGRS